jgi:thiol-disulfide isomerase/thioredoxin
MKLKIGLMAMLCLFFEAKGQPGTAASGLQVGAKVPDVSLGKMLYYSAGTAKFSDFKDQLLILDFWATWCSACIARFPENYAMQREHPGKVQFILISQKRNKDTETGIRKFLDLRKKDYSFPCVVGDTILDRLFPHGSIPHYVIIKNNRVLAITDAESINANNISRMIDDKELNLFIKQDYKLNKDLPLFQDGNGGNPPTALYRSLITGYKLPVQGGGISFITNAEEKMVGIYAINQVLPALYLSAYPDYSDIPWTRIIFNITHPELLPKDSLRQLDYQKRVFSYESKFPPVEKSEALRFFRADLMRYFALKPQSVMKDTFCYVLRIDKDKPPLKVPPGTLREMNISEGNTLPKYMRDYGVESLRIELEEKCKVPFLNETEYPDNISVDLPADIRNPAELTRALRKQGLLLSREIRKVKFLLLSQQPD